VRTEINERIASVATREGGAPDGESAPVTSADLAAIRDLISAFVPKRAIVAVVTRGDGRFLEIGRRAWHFPRQSDGRYLGYHPGDSLAAIACLQAVRAQGAAFLLVPAAFVWWLEHYDDFEHHLSQNYVRVTDEGAVLFDLRHHRASTRARVNANLSQLLSRSEAALGRPPSVLDCWSGADVAAAFPKVAVFEPPDAERELPYLDKTFDFVVVGTNGASLEEAIRVGQVVVTAEASEHPGRGTRWRVTHDGRGEERVLPSATIVIPCYDGWAITETCLRMVRETLPPGGDHEVLVIDDASTDGSGEKLKAFAKAFPQMQVVRNRKNRGFIESCNLGVRLASNEGVVFLNNDTIPLPGWLEPLLATLDEPEVGLVGGKLLWPDGILQEAGGVVFSNARGANFGRGSPTPAAPLFNYRRPVDYCSGALLGVRRSDFLGLGGFDRRYRPAYYEDTDLAFSVRNARRSVVFNPESVVLHLEGASSSTSAGPGTKRFQELNREKFARKWRAALTRQPHPPGRFDSDTWFRLAASGPHPSEGML